MDMAVMDMAAMDMAAMDMAVMDTITVIDTPDLHGHLYIGEVGKKPVKDAERMPIVLGKTGAAVHPVGLTQNAIHRQ